MPLTPTLISFAAKEWLTVNKNEINKIRFFMLYSLKMYHVIESAPSVKSGSDFPKGIFNIES
jgi:hypothetical protein